jgi:7,8-dihydropterin-6-yl-methyl-4-(beta-D-ribofuranosyl)aminobenzene 5'-phosphate synthase
MDDFCPKGKLRGEHGLSYYIETDSAKVLFDTGQTDALIANAGTLGVDLDRLDAVVLSHGHYDHCGGLSALFEAVAPARPAMYAGKGYSVRKWARTNDGLSDIGLPESSRPPRVPAAIEVDAIVNPFPGLFLQPRAERVDGATANPRFRLIEAGVERMDDFDDELSIVVEERGGIVVITGCAHRGIVNIVKAAMRAFPGKPLAAIVGGFHLGDAPDGTLSLIADGIAELAPGRILCGHCTGTRGFAAISARNRDVSWLACGMRVDV